MIDEEEYAEVKEQVDILTEAIEIRNQTHIDRLYGDLFAQILSKTNPYNIADLNYKTPTIYSLDLGPLMNGPVRDHLQIIPTDVTWGKKTLYPMYQNMRTFCVHLFLCNDCIIGFIDFMLFVFPGFGLCEQSYDYPCDS